MAVLPITRVSVGDTLVVSKPSIANTSLIIKTVGISTPIFNKTIVSSAYINGGSINFTLTVPAIEQVGSAIRFTFSGATIQPKVTAGNQTSYGLTAVKKGAGVIAPKGVDSQSHGTALMIPQGLKKYDIDLNSSQPYLNSKNIFFHFGPIVIAGVSAGNLFASGKPKLINAFNIRPTGIKPASDNSKPSFIYTNDNKQRLMNINLADPLQAERGVRFKFGGSNLITQAGGIYQFGAGTPKALNKSIMVKPTAIESRVDFGSHKTYPLGSTDGNNQYGVFTTNLQQANQPQNSLNIPFSFFTSFQLTNIGFQSSVVGAAAIENSDTIITTAGWQSTEYGSQHNVVSDREVVSPVGFDSSVIDKPNIINSARSINLTGIASPVFSIPLIYNLKQFVTLTGYAQSSYGSAYLQGGVRWVTPSGVAALATGTPVLRNTTANQYAYAKGIARTAIVPAPIVSPHMIHARGIYATEFGSAKAIPAEVLRHKGVNHMVGGTPTVWYHTRSLGAIGFNSFDTGYPKVFDPTQFIQQSAFNRTAVFGDTYARNNLILVIGAGAIDDLAVSQWSVIENRNKQYLAKGFLSQAFGAQSIRNKSPSIFFHGLPAPTFNAPSIGYAVRSILLTGFDRLGLGNPKLTKTPQLFPLGFIATQFGQQWISNHTRTIENSSKDHSVVSKPTVWFRFRYAAISSWQSSKFGDKSSVTHGVREMIGHGFSVQAYGNAWVSYAVRLIEPKSITTKQLSNHYVGRHQEIKPLGFIATQFGTRIIPESLSIYPLGFTGAFGLSTAYLQTQHINPKGYMSAGEQAAFRWGRQIVYNAVQYITQNYAGDSGLVPPKWSDWTAIENRNKTIGAIGTLMQKFGYSQIDNHARLIEPKGLIATGFDKNLIAYRIRQLPLQGIEPPYMSDWLIVHNGARVIAPVGANHATIGNADLINTRRYYRSVGRIESQEFGTSMIAYRIRTIDIEKRYSIAPPIIRLPTVDLHTRYVEFNGYEAAKYGLASLSIHFRIITPRWTHRERVGNPALHNVTPELLARGHDSQEYGNTSIRTQWRDVYAQGDDTSSIGLLKISDTKQHIQVRGFLDSLASQNHIVTKTGSAPYSVQNIWLHDEDESSQGEGYGIEPPRMTNPSLNQNVLYPISDKVSSRFGVQFVWSNNLTVDGGIGLVQDAVSIPSVRNKDNIISVTSQKIESQIAFGKPSLSPHTIYAVLEAPAQAIENHRADNGGGLHYVGNYEDGRHTAGEVFGKAFIESSIRTIKPYWGFDQHLLTGRPTATLVRRIIKPNGIRLGRFGVPIIPFSLQKIGLYEGIYDSSINNPSITRPPYIGPQQIKPIGLYSTVFGQTYSDNFTRTLTTLGSNSLSMGLSKPHDKPFMWQGLRVGEHVPLVIGGDDMSRHGLTWISLRVREVEANGFNAFLSEYTLSAFDKRMNVSNKDKQIPITTTINAEGIYPASNIGYQDIKLGQRYIRPDGNSDQFRKGGHHA